MGIVETASESRMPIDRPVCLSILHSPRDDRREAPGPGWTDADELAALEAVWQSLCREAVSAR
jgi:hypothetical protein